MGTLNVLESLRELRKNCIAVLITSDKSYKNLEIKRGYRENDILGGNDPYSASKACSEIIFESFYKTYHTKKTAYKSSGSVRSGNVIGGGDFKTNRIIPDIIRSIIFKKQLIILPYNPGPLPWV